MKLLNILLADLAWIPIGLIVAFIVIGINRRSGQKRKCDGFYGGEGYLSSLPDEASQRNRKHR